MDRRQRKTRRAIYQAFEELMAEEHYSQVTVAQIIERADIGRSTFYAHFETKDELLDQMCTEMFDHIFEGVNTHCITHADLEADDLGGRIAHLLYHLRDTYAGVCGKLLMEGEPHFTAYFEKRLADLFARTAPGAPEGMPESLMNCLLVAGFMETVRWWFEGDCKRCSDDPEQVAAWLLLPLKDEVVGQEAVGSPA